MYAGGTSTGSAVAVAVGSAFAALGTDTGGSVRVPAAVTGTVGFKPTFGRVSRAGVVGLSTSLDHVGLLARSSGDCALLLQVLTGADRRDPATLEAPPLAHDERQSTRDLAGVRIGVARDFFFPPAMPAGIAALVHAALDDLAALGAEVVDVVIPGLEESSEAAAVIVLVEAAARHGHMLADGHADLGASVREALERGTRVPARSYLEAQQARKRLRGSVERVWREHRLDAVAAPTAPLTTVPLGALHEPWEADGTLTPLAAYLHHAYPANLTGHPAVSVPCGEHDCLPVGLQLIGGVWDDQRLLAIADCYETATGATATLPRARVALAGDGRGRPDSGQAGA
jgi:aspartyl-tRNA(Asn)/glutamyl-tRNA(Gln) amidotransferase subunit A